MIFVMSSELSKISKKLGKNIKIARIKQDLSQEKAAEKAGISLVAFGAIENGKSSPKVETVAKIAAALNVEISSLFMFDD